ncbi:MAG: LPS assembly lipoprotein LptE [Phycisphaerae bacterium]
MTMRFRIMVVCLAGMTAVLSGCGYSTKRPFSTDIDTIHVEMFESKDFRRELEFRLTESLVKRIEMDTPYRIASKLKADALLSGEILEVYNRTFGDDRGTGRPREIGATVIVRYRMQDMRNGDVLVEYPRFIYQTSFIPPVGETFTDAMTRAMDGMAQRIVETMEVAW